MNQTTNTEILQQFGRGFFVLLVSYLFYKLMKSTMKKGKTYVISSKITGFSMDVFKWYYYLSKAGIIMGIFFIVTAFIGFILKVF